MQRDVTPCIICISNKFKYFEKEKGEENITKEVVLSF